VIPHSRINAVTTDAVLGAGYRVALDSQDSGWSLITKRMERCEVLCVQGHPEYEPSSLLREYRRDVRRYLDHERDALPCLPLHCAAGTDWELLQQLQRRMIAGERDPEMALSFPFDEAASRAGWPWRSTAVNLFTQWLAAAPKRSS
jgi:homoserine O-succinyltransferase